MKRSLYWSAAAALALVLGSTQARAADCVGDCNASGDVTVDEIVTMVNLALNGGTTGCGAGDSNGDGAITVDEIITAVNYALIGCPTVGPTPTPTTTPSDGVCGDGSVNGGQGEECDDGGFCAGGEDAGKACDSESDCAGSVGACIGGPNNLRGCTSNDGCPDGTCQKCRPVGGDGCAQNCTSETDLPYPYKDGIADGVNIVDGTGATVFGPFLTVPLAIKPTAETPQIFQILTVGKSRNGSPVPVAIKASNVKLPAIAVQTIACACVRGAEQQTCGGVIFDETGVQAPNCTPGFENPTTCPANRPCAPVHGPGNTASGFIDCASDATEYNVVVSQDCNGTPGEPPFPVQAAISTGATNAPGSMYIVNGAAIGTVVGSCSGAAPDYGPDGKFCTADDDPTSLGSPNSIPLTSGTARGIVYNPADFEGDVLGPDGAELQVSGARFTCSGSQVTSTTGVNLAGVFTSCDQPTISDIVVVNNFESKQ